MLGALDLIGWPEAETIRSMGTPERADGGSMFAIMLCDESMTSDQFDEACAIASNDLSDDCDAKVSVVILPPRHPLLDSVLKIRF